MRLTSLGLGRDFGSPYRDQINNSIGKPFEVAQKCLELATNAEINSLTNSEVMSNNQLPIVRQWAAEKLYKNANIVRNMINIVEKYNSILSLQELSRIQIRWKIGGIHFKSRATKLPLPQNLKEYVIMQIETTKNGHERAE